MTGWGTYLTYGLFFESILEEFGWTRAVTSGAYSISILISGALSVVFGRISDKLGPKMVVIFCGVCLGLGYMLMSRANSVWQVYIIYALLLSAGIGGLWPPLISTTARWFKVKRGLMTGIVACGIGLSTLVFSPIVSRLIEAYGWRNTYSIIGIIALVVLVVSALFLKRVPRQTSIATYGEINGQKTSPAESTEYSFKDAVHMRQFWMLAIMYLLFGYGQVAVLVHIVPYALTQDISPITASNILAVIGIISIFSRIIIGIISDRIPAKPLLVFSIFIGMLSMAWLVFADSLWALYLFGIGFGFAWGSMSMLQPLISVHMFGLTSLGVLLGSFAFSHCIGGTLGPTISGYIADVSGSYKMAFLICTVMAFLALLSALWVTPEKRSQVQE